METLYNWLLYNMGNEGNYLTILNVQRQPSDTGIDRLDVMARTSEFETVNLLIQPTDAPNTPTDEPVQSDRRTLRASYHFTGDDQVITYLTEGRTNESAAGAEASGIRVSVLEPTDGTSEITFPPE